MLQNSGSTNQVVPCNIYQEGTKVVLPVGIAEGKGLDFSEGQVCSYNLKQKDMLKVKWADGHESMIKTKHVITREKYDQLTDAGLKTYDIIDYLKLFNGHIYN